MSLLFIMALRNGRSSSNIYFLNARIAVNPLRGERTFIFAYSSRRMTKQSPSTCVCKGSIYFSTPSTGDYRCTFCHNDGLRLTPFFSRDIIPLYHVPSQQNSQFPRGGTSPLITQDGSPCVVVRVNTNK